MEFAVIRVARQEFRTANYTRFVFRNGARTLQALYSEVQARPNVRRFVLIKSSGTKLTTNDA